MTQRVECKFVARWAIVAASSILILYMAAVTWIAYRDSKDQPPETRLFDDPVKESLAIRLDASRNLFQVGLLLAGALWALYIGKTEETKVDLTQTPELILFLLCNFCFLISFYSHYEYTDRLSTWINSAVISGEKIEIPDIDAPRLTNLLDRQTDFFQIGCGLALLTFVSGRYLRTVIHEQSATRDSRPVLPNNPGPGC